MALEVLRVEGLPTSPLDAAADFHHVWLPLAREALSEEKDLALVLPAAGREHRAWRLAAVQELAREAAPRRVNAVAGDAEDAVAQALAYLEGARGVTGQVLAVDGKTGEKD
jgi:hypothetical protein